MDAEVMEFRMKQWLPIFEEQAGSGLGKDDWCDKNGISRHSFFKWQREIRKYMLQNHLKMPNITNEYFQPELGFVDITGVITAPAIAKNTKEPVLCPHEIPAFSGLNIRYGGFSVELNETTDERLLTMALQVISNVK